MTVLVDIFLWLHYSYSTMGPPTFVNLENRSFVKIAAKEIGLDLS
jgi:hypothetical protein